MKSYFYLLLFVTNAFVFKAQQHHFQVWAETGIDGKISKRFDYSVDWTNRFGDGALQTTFGQASIRFKATKWFKPSLDYRWIGNREDNTNYTYNHRINGNLNFYHDIKRVSISLRVRYQYSFNTFAAGSYEPEFDKAIRIKPAFTYDVPKFIFNPTASIEFFYNPSYSELGQRFTKIRYYAGLKLDTKGPHGFDFGFLLDQRINLPGEVFKHCLSLNYTYSIPKVKKKKKD